MRKKSTDDDPIFQEVLRERKVRTTTLFTDFFGPNIDLVLIINYNVL
jgi:hypothetical protein